MEIKEVVGDRAAAAKCAEHAEFAGGIHTVVIVECKLGVPYRATHYLASAFFVHMHAPYGIGIADDLLYDEVAEI